MRNFNKLALLVVLGSGFAVAQSMPQSTTPSSPSTSPSSSQSQPATPDQQPSTTAPDQSKSPDTLPNTDQKKSDTQTSDQNKMPQSDAAPSAAANGDVQGNIQSAIQKDPSLATAGVNVNVTGKTVELTGTVPNKDAKDSAERIAKENAGSLKVKNHLKIASNSDKSKPDTMSNPKL